MKKARKGVNKRKSYPAPFLVPRALTHAPCSSSVFQAAALTSHCSCVAMSIFEYNGAAIVAMAGKNCVAIGSDLRFGVQLQTITTDVPKVFKMHDKLFIGFSGLATDAQTLYEKLVFR